MVVEVTDRVQARRELEHHARRQELLARASAALNRHLDPAAEIQELARAVVPELADLSTVHLLAQPVAPGTDPPLPMITDRVAVAGAPGVTLPPKLTGLRWDGDGDPITAVIRQGGLLRQPLPAAEPPAWAQTTGSAATFRGGLRHVVLAPVIVDGLVVAVVSFCLQRNRPLWSENDLHALSQIARYRPAGRDEVGGDWYVAFLRRPDQLAVVIGDVVGHDITAAAAMGHLRATLRGLTLDRCEGPATILDRLAAINTRLAITRSRPCSTPISPVPMTTGRCAGPAPGTHPHCSSHPAVLNCWSGSPAPPWSPPRLRRAPRLRSPCPLDRPCCSTPTAWSNVAAAP